MTQIESGTAGSILGLIVAFSATYSFGAPGEGAIVSLIILPLVGAWTVAFLGTFAGVTGGIIGGLLAALFTHVPVLISLPASATGLDVIITKIVVVGVITLILYVFAPH